VIEILITALTTWFFTKKYYTYKEYIPTNIFTTKCYHCSKTFTINTDDHRVYNLCYDCKSGLKLNV